jgi:hypothetical protein
MPPSPACNKPNAHQTRVLLGFMPCCNEKNIIPTFTWDYNKGDIKYMLKHGKTMLPKGAHIVGQAAGERASSTNLRPIKSARRFRNSFISSVHWVDWRQNLWTKNGIQRERERSIERDTEREREKERERDWEKGNRRYTPPWFVANTFSRVQPRYLHRMLG